MMRVSGRSFRAGLLGGASRVVAGAALFLWAGHAALAAPPQLTLPTDEQLQPGQPGQPGQGGLFGFTSSLARSNYMLGNMWGLRPFLSQYGISFGLQETSEGVAHG